MQVTEEFVSLTCTQLEYHFIKDKLKVLLCKSFARGDEYGFITTAINLWPRHLYKHSW